MEIEFVNPESLVPFEGNPKEHTKSQIKHIAESVKRFGMTQPIVVDEEGKILIGHGRWAATKLAGMKEVPVVRLRKLTKEQKAALLIVDNTTNSETGFDATKLDALYQALAATDEDWEALGLQIEQLGKGRQEPPDRDKLKEAFEKFKNAEVKQLVLYFLPEEYQEFTIKFEALLDEQQTKAGALLKMLDKWEAAQNAS